MANWVLLQEYFNLTNMPHCVCCSDYEDTPLCLLRFRRRRAAPMDLREDDTDTVFFLAVGSPRFSRGLLHPHILLPFSLYKIFLQTFLS